MASVQEFIENEATVRFERGDLNVEVTYKPNMISAAQNTKLQRLIDSGDELAAARIMAETITDWDLMGPLSEWQPERNAKDEIVYDDDGNEKGSWVQIVEPGEKIPPKPRYIASIPTSLMMALWLKVQEDTMPNPQTRNGRGSRRR